MIEVIPISVTLADVSGLAKIAKETLGYDVARAVDREKLSLRDPRALFLILSKFNDCPAILDHFHYGFAIVAQPKILIKVMSLTSRSLATTISENTNLIVISGTLKDWNTILGSVLTTGYSVELRIIFGKIFSYFEAMGLRTMLKGIKQGLDDGTFVLCPR